MLRLLVGVVVALIVVVAALWLFQRRLIYLPTQRVPPIDLALPGWEEVTFTTADGLVLGAWFREPEESRPVVMVFGGNAGNRADRASLGRGLAAEGLGVLLVDYRGYGTNPGHPTEGGLALDARGALRWVLDQAPGHPVVYFGESLGSAVAIGLASEHPPAALVLRSPFTRLADVGAVHYPLLPVRWMLWDVFPSIDRIRGVATAALVIAGDADSIIPVTQSRAIYDAAPEPKRLLVLEGADHNDPALTNGPEVIAATVRFIEDVTGE